jgi:PAS domain S-box-containing protein
MSAEWEFLITLNEHLRPLRDPLEIQEVALRLLGEHLQVSRVTFAYIDGDEFAISRSWVRDIPPLPGRGQVAHFGVAMVDAWRHGDTAVTNDVSTDSRFTAADRARLLAGQTPAFVGVPLIKDGQWVAEFGVTSSTPRAWTPEQIALIEVTAERTWGIGERARAEDALGRTESRQAFLRRLTDTVRPLAENAAVVEETCRLLGTYLRVNRAIYLQIDGDDAISLGSYNDGLAPLPTRFSWRGLAGSRVTEMLKGGTLTINDTGTEVHTPEEARALRAGGIGAYISPQLVKDGHRVAAFGVHSRLPRVWTPDEIALVEEVAERTWATLEHRDAERGLRAKEERLAFLLRLNDALRPLSDAAAVQETAARLLGEHLGASRVHYLELEGAEYVIRCEYTHGVAPLAERGSLATFDGALRGAYSRGETVIVNDTNTDPRLSGAEREALIARQMASFVGVTLIKGGRAVAAFSASQSTPREWTTAETSLVRDVAERTWEAAGRARAEAAVREQEHRLRLALEASAGGSFTWNAITNEVHWDERFRALYGFALDERPDSKAWLSRLHEDDRARVLSGLDELLTPTANDSWDNVFRIVRPDGTVVWIQSRGRAERDAEGRVIRLTGLDLDFSQHQMAEEALQARREEAHSDELRLLIETATQGVVMVDAQGTIVMANRALKAMFGWPPGQLLGQPIERLLPPKLRDIHVGHRTNYFATPRARLMEGGLRLVGQRKDGSTFPIEVTLNHIPTAAGGRAIAFVTDITDRLRAAATLQQRTAELEARTTQLSQMAWDLTLAEHHAREQIARTLHDGLQQLLVIAALNLEQQIKREAESGIASDDLLLEAKHQLDEAINAARSLTLELFPAVLQRSGLPAALTWLAKWTRDKYRLNVDVSADPAADTTRKDVRTLLFESTRELLFNIVKHSGADRAIVRLELDPDDQVCITVADDGVGFEPSDLDERWKSGDVGWGLFSIRDRLALLGGRLDIDSSPGDGSRIRIVAPRRVGGRRGAAGRVQELIPTMVPNTLGRDGSLPANDALRILIVDDHEAVRGAMRRALNRLPQLSVVGEASNGYEAIAETRAQQPDVVLMDVLMPLMDGIDATTHVHAEFPEVEIIGFSMLAKTETVHAIEQAGASAYFVKGTDTQRLIDYLLELYAARTLRGARV